MIEKLSVPDCCGNCEHWSEYEMECELEAKLNPSEEESIVRGAEDWCF